MFFAKGGWLSLIFLLAVRCSPGDKDSAFGMCVRKCALSHCRNNASPLPLTLRLTFWSCRDDCKYSCMHEITAHHKSTQQPILQYYGKWPFYRFLGLQEPLAVLFSIGNGVGHYYGYQSLRALPPITNPLRRLYMFFGVLGMIVWTWSSLFHARDFNWTEKGDYFAAVGGLIYVLFLSAVRAFKITRTSHQVYLLLSGFTFFVFHVLYLSLWPFDYTYNMAAGVTIGVLSNVFWLYWYFTHRRKRAYAWKQGLFILGITLAMSMEVLDFPPIWGMLDAHALWHGLTVPLVPLHYSFLVDDARYESRVKREKGLL